MVQRFAALDRALHFAQNAKGKARGATLWMRPFRFTVLSLPFDFTLNKSHAHGQGRARSDKSTNNELRALVHFSLGTLSFCFFSVADAVLKDLRAERLVRRAIEKVIAKNA